MWIKYVIPFAIDLVERLCDILKVATITALCQDSYGRSLQGDILTYFAWQIWWHKSSNKPGCDCFRNLFLTAFVFNSQYPVQYPAHHAISSTH